jgi:O-antigen/teichoic acid export membrane protein
VGRTIRPVGFGSVTATATASSRGLRGGAAIAIAMGVMNLATYGYTVVAAHTIGKEDFGAFSALMGVLLVVNVLSLGLQATGARRIAAHPTQVSSIEAVVLGVGVRSAAALGVLCLLISPLIWGVLRLDSMLTAMLVAVAVVPLTYMGAQAGVLQGERRWGPLALVYLFQGLGRVMFGVVLMLVWPTEFSAMLGVALGAWLPVLVGHLALRRPRVDQPRNEGHPGIELIREVGHSSQALLAFFALSNADILLARASLSQQEAGLYAGGLIMAKAILFLPQFIVVIAFPSMARAASRRTLLLVLGTAAALGIVGMLAILALPGLALTFIGGDEYAGISGDLWKFAIIGSLLSMIQLLVYSALARRQGRALVMIWTTLLLLVAGAFWTHHVSSLAGLVVTLDGLLCLSLFVTAMLASHAGPPEATPTDDVEHTLLHNEG